MPKTHRSAATGRYVTGSAAATHPRTTVTESGPGRGSTTVHRSAITGRYVAASAAARNPRTTLTENA